VHEEERGELELSACADSPSPVRAATVNEDLLALYDRGRVPVWRIYEPAQVLAVLGAAGDPARDLILDNLKSDGIPFRFRKGGGGAVILSPGQAVLALVTEVSSPFRNREYAREINLWFAEAASALGTRGVEARGIADLAIGEKKILGSSIYRRKLLLFYQASLLVSNDLSLFGRYLRMPARVPDYRRGRRHEEFCTTLARECSGAEVFDVIEVLGKIVEQKIGALR
jgi:lipoate-protein ligase A